MIGPVPFRYRLRRWAALIALWITGSIVVGLAIYSAGQDGGIVTP